MQGIAAVVRLDLGGDQAQPAVPCLDPARQEEDGSEPDGARQVWLVEPDGLQGAGTVGDLGAQQVLAAARAGGADRGHSATQGDLGVRPQEGDGRQAGSVLVASWDVAQGIAAGSE